MINSNELDATFQRPIGYVQQQDSYLPTTTVRGILKFCSKLETTRVSTENRKGSYIYYIINLMEMENSLILWLVLLEKVMNNVGIGFANSLVYL